MLVNDGSALGEFIIPAVLMLRSDKNTYFRLAFLVFGSRNSSLERIL